MILKIKGLEKKLAGSKKYEEWILFDNIGKIKHYKAKTPKTKIADYDVINDNEKTGISIYVVCAFKDGRENIIIFNTFGYILSDCGKIIERLNI